MEMQNDRGVMGMPELEALRRKLSRRYKISRSLASFLALLIINECVDQEELNQRLGYVDYRGLAFRLRRALKDHVPTAVITNQRSVGYWLDEVSRCKLARENGVPHDASRLAS